MPTNERDALKAAVSATANLIKRQEPRLDPAEDVDAAIEQASRRPPQ